MLRLYNGMVSRLSSSSFVAADDLEGAYEGERNAAGAPIFVHAILRLDPRLPAARKSYGGFV